MFAEDCVKWEGWSDSACGYRGGAVPQSTAELCFVNTRVNFAQGASLLEMLRGEIRVCNVICAAGVCVIHFTTKPTEISASWSMSEQALQGQLIQRSGLQSCWDKQKTDALLGIWHLSFTGASLSGDHSAALQPAWCKSDCAVVPWWVTIPGQSSFKLTSDQRSQAKDALPPQHSTAPSPCHGPVLVLRARGFLFSIMVMPVGKLGLSGLGLCLWPGLEEKGCKAQGGTWWWRADHQPSQPGCWNGQELLWHQTQCSHAGAAAVGAAACALCWCS